MEFFNLFAPFYDGFMRLIGKKNIQFMVEKIRTKLPGRSDLSSPHLILDVGGGTGTLAAKLQSEKHQVFVLDRSEKMLSKAKGKGIPGENLVQSDVRSIPFNDEIFDLVTCLDALHHFPESEKGLKEMARVLKPGGIILIFDFDPEKKTTKVLKNIERCLGEPTEFYTPEGLRDLLWSFGIEGEIKPQNAWQFLYEGQKKKRRI